MHPPLPNGVVVPAPSDSNNDSARLQDSLDTSAPTQDTHSLSPQPVKLIRIRSTSRLGRKGTTSKRLAEDDQQDEDEEEAEPDTPSYEGLLPFALVAPEKLGGVGADGKAQWAREFK